MGREEGKIALYPFHETPRAPQPNPQSSLIPKKYESVRTARFSNNVAGVMSVVAWGVVR